MTVGILPDYLQMGPPFQAIIAGKTTNNLRERGRVVTRSARMRRESVCFGRLGLRNSTYIG